MYTKKWEILFQKIMQKRQKYKKNKINTRAGRSCLLQNIVQKYSAIPKVVVFFFLEKRHVSNNYDAYLKNGIF